MEQEPDERTAWETPDQKLVMVYGKLKAPTLLPGERITALTASPMTMFYLIDKPAVEPARLNDLDSEPPTFGR